MREEASEQTQCVTCCFFGMPKNWVFKKKSGGGCLLFPHLASNLHSTSLECGQLVCQTHCCLLKEDKDRKNTWGQALLVSPMRFSQKVMGKRIKIAKCIALTGIKKKGPINNTIFVKDGIFRYSTERIRLFKQGIKRGIKRKSEVLSAMSNSLLKNNKKKRAHISPIQLNISVENQVATKPWFQRQHKYQPKPSASCNQGTGVIVSACLSSILSQPFLRPGENHQPRI